MARGEEAVVVIDQEAAPLVVTEPIGDDDVMERQLCPSAASPEEKSGVQQAALIESEIRSEMAEAESRNDISGGGCDDGGRATASGACSGVAGDEFVTALASMSCSESSESTSCCAEASEYVTAGMRELQIKTTIEKSRAQGWSEFAANGAGDGASADDQSLWEQLKQRYPKTFVDMEDELKLGRVIAEGGQSVIYEVFGRLPGRSWVAKVFKMEGFSLAGLRRQWPFVTHFPFEGFYEPVFGNIMIYCCTIYWCTYLKDGRIAFLMRRYWGDLRTLINLRMSDRDSVGQAPFYYHTALKVISQIAQGLRGLHGNGVLHRDLKAANVLIDKLVGHEPRDSDLFICEVADYESAMVVVGTGFWRAPEILEYLLKKPCDRGDVDMIWTEKSDVYSFAMTCYEVLTGHTPFYGYEKMDWKRIIDGERPYLPHYVPPATRKLVERCWHKEPYERPDIIDIVDEVKRIEKALWT